MSKLLLNFTLLTTIAFSQISPAQIFSGTAKRVRGGDTLPASCGAPGATGDVFVKTGASPGFYICNTVDTWTQIGGSGTCCSAASGTATAPGISFSAHSGTGFYRIANYTLGAAKDNSLTFANSSNNTTLYIDSSTILVREASNNYGSGEYKIDRSGSNIAAYLHADGFYFRNSSGTINGIGMDSNGILSAMDVNLSAYRQFNTIRLGLKPDTEGTCNSTTRGNIVFTASGTGVADHCRVCSKLDDDSYAWISLF